MSCVSFCVPDIPELLVLHTVPSNSRVQTILFTQCIWSWSQESQTTFTIVKLILLYTGPLLFMSVAYWQIVRVLWRSNIPGHNRKRGTMSCIVNPRPCKTLRDVVWQMKKWRTNPWEFAFLSGTTGQEFPLPQCEKRSLPCKEASPTERVSFMSPPRGISDWFLNAKERMCFYGFHRELYAVAPFHNCSPESR